MKNKKIIDAGKEYIDIINSIKEYTPDIYKLFDIDDCIDNMSFCYTDKCFNLNFVSVDIVKYLIIMDDNSINSNSFEKLLYLFDDLSFKPINNFSMVFDKEISNKILEESSKLRVLFLADYSKAIGGINDDEYIPKIEELKHFNYHNENSMKTMFTINKICSYFSSIENNELSEDVFNDMYNKILNEKNITLYLFDNDQMSEIHVLKYDGEFIDPYKTNRDNYQCRNIHNKLFGIDLSLKGVIKISVKKEVE